jgi:hypothetical protein
MKNKRRYAPSKFGGIEMAGGFFSQIYQESYDPSVRRARKKNNISFMFKRKPERRELCYADILSRLPRRIIDRDMVMPAARAFASGYIDRATMMRWINAEELRWDDPTSSGCFQSAYSENAGSWLGGPSRPRQCATPRNRRLKPEAVVTSPRY